MPMNSCCLLSSKYLTIFESIYLQQMEHNRQLGSAFIKWAKMADNKERLKKFCDELIRNMETVFITSIKSTGSIVNREKFFLLRSSTSYQKKWEVFLGPILSETSSTALFYQCYRCTVQVAGKIALLPLLQVTMFNFTG